MKNKFFKSVVSVISSIVITSTMLIGCYNDKAEKSGQLSGNINVWSWNEELLTSGIIDKFEEAYPNVKVNLITIPNDNNAYSTKLIATLRSGVNAPDVYLAESANVKRLCNMDYYEDLSKEPYNAEKLTDQMVPYTVKLGRNDNDNSIRALTWQATPGGYFYRRSLAKKYLGTDDINEVQKMMTSMEDFIKLGEKIRDESNGEVSLLANYSELLYVVLANRSEGWVKDGKLIIDPAMEEYLDLATEIRSKSLDINAKQWTPKWTESMSSGEVFGFMLPTWGLSNTLQANAPDTEGDWAFVKAPSSYYWGGTWIGMYKDGKKKDISWEFIKFVATNKDFLQQYAKDSGDFVNNKAVQDTISNSEEGNNSFLNGQNVYKSYSSLVDSINGDIITEYDETLNNLWSDSVDLYMSGNISREDVIENFKEKVKATYPKLEV